MRRSRRFGPQPRAPRGCRCWSRRRFRSWRARGVPPCGICVITRLPRRPLLSVVSGGDDDGHVVVLPDELVDLVAGLVVVVGFQGSPAVAHQPHALLVATSQRSFRVTTHRSSRGRGCWAYSTPPCRSPGRRPSVDCRTRGPASSVTRGDTL